MSTKKSATITKETRTGAYVVRRDTGQKTVLKPSAKSAKSVAGSILTNRDALKRLADR